MAPSFCFVFLSTIFHRVFERLIVQRCFDADLDNMVTILSASLGSKISPLDTSNSISYNCYCARHWC